MLAKKDGKYTIYEVHRLVKKEVNFFLNNKKIKHFQKDCEIIFDGCKFCGTQFNFEDFQCKVNQVHFRDTAMVTFHGIAYALLYIKQLSLCSGVLGILAYHLIRMLMPYLGKVPPSGIYNLFLGTLGAFNYGTFLGGLAIFTGSIFLSLVWAVIINPIVTAKYNHDMWKNNMIAGKVREKDAAFSAESFLTVLNSRMQVLHYAKSKEEIEAFIKCDVEKLLP